MEIKLIQVETESDIKLYAEQITNMVKYHQQFAGEIGYRDAIVDRYGHEDAISQIGKEGFHQYKIIADDVKVGALDVQECKLNINDTPSVMIQGIWIDEQYRGEGL